MVPAPLFSPVLFSRSSVAIAYELTCFHYTTVLHRFLSFSFAPILSNQPQGCRHCNCTPAIVFPCFCSRDTHTLYDVFGGRASIRFAPALWCARPCNRYLCHAFPRRTFRCSDGRNWPTSFARPRTALSLLPSCVFLWRSFSFHLAPSFCRVPFGSFLIALCSFPSALSWWASPSAPSFFLPRAPRLSCVLGPTSPARFLARPGLSSLGLFAFIFY